MKQYLPEVPDTVRETPNEEQNIEEISDPGAETWLLLQYLLLDKLFWGDWR